MSKKPIVIFVLGGPGSGKGTQCQMLSQHFGFIHLSAGDLLREERKTPGSEYGEVIESCIVQGQIVPSHITVMLLERAIHKTENAKQFLIDGFPRNLQNYEGWEKVMQEKVVVPFLINFQCSEAVMEARLLNRGLTSGRTDDNLDSIRKRFGTFKSQTMPILAKFEAKKLVRNFNADRPWEAVFDQIVETLKKQNIIQI